MKYYSEVLEVKTWFLGEEKLEKEKNRKKKKKKGKEKKDRWNNTGHVF